MHSDHLGLSDLTNFVSPCSKVEEVSERIGREFGIVSTGGLRLHTDGFTHPANATADLLQHDEMIVVEKMGSGRKRKRTEQSAAEKQNDSSHDDARIDDDGGGDSSSGQSGNDDSDSEEGAENGIKVDAQQRGRLCAHRKNEPEAQRPRKKRRNDRWLGKTVTIKKGPKMGLVGIVQEKVRSLIASLQPFDVPSWLILGWKSVFSVVAREGPYRGTSKLFQAEPTPRGTGTSKTARSIAKPQGGGSFRSAKANICPPGRCYFRSAKANRFRHTLASRVQQNSVTAAATGILLL